MQTARRLVKGPDTAKTSKKIISGHGFCGHPWLSRSEESLFSLSAREGLTLVLGFCKLYILYPSQ